MIYSDAEAKHLVSQELFVEKMNEVATAMGGGGGGGNNDFLVSFELFTDGGWSATCDKTYAQIVAAIDAGKRIVSEISFAGDVDLPGFAVRTETFLLGKVPFAAFAVNFMLAFTSTTAAFTQIAVQANDKVTVVTVDLGEGK